jgi:hypothetical protein
LLSGFCYRSGIVGNLSGGSQSNWSNKLALKYLMGWMSRHFAINQFIWNWNKMILDMFDDPFYFSPSWRRNHPAVFPISPLRPSVLTYPEASPMSSHRYRRLHSLFDDFIDDMAQAFPDYFDEPESHSSEEKSDTKTSPETSDASKQQKEGKPTEKEGDTKKTTSTRPQQPVRTSYFARSTKTSSGDRGDVREFEERREKITDSEGQSRTFTLRRIGDQWYESEVVRDKEGKESQRENWHNVGESEQEGFKERWQNRSQKSLTKEKKDVPASPALTHKQAPGK